jgi:hypothetical protein
MLDPIARDAFEYAVIDQPHIVDNFSFVGVEPFPETPAVDIAGFAGNDKQCLTKFRMKVTSFVIGAGRLEVRCASLAETRLC